MSNIGSDIVCQNICRKIGVLKRTTCSILETDRYGSRREYRCDPFWIGRKCHDEDDDNDTRHYRDSLSYLSEAPLRRCTEVHRCIVRRRPYDVLASYIRLRVKRDDNWHQLISIVICRRICMPRISHQAITNRGSTANK